MILVTGATGNVGSEVVRAVIGKGAPVRALVRDPERARQRLGDEVELAVGDFADPLSLRRALEAVDELVLSCSDDPRRIGWETRMIDLAQAAGVRRIVKLSAIGAAPGSPVAFWDWHHRVERHLEQSGVPGVILRSSFYMTSLLMDAGQIAEGHLIAPAGDARIAMIDPRDVGAATASVLSTDAHDGRTYVLTGPEAISYAEVAATLSAAIHRRIEFIHVPDAKATEGLIDAGLPEFAARNVVTIFAMAREGAAEQVTDSVESLTGRPARRLAAFVRDHAHLLVPEPAGAGR